MNTRITAAVRGFTPRRLKPFTWSWFLMKITCAPIAAGLFTFVFIGFTNTDVIHAQVENGQVVHEWATGMTPQEDHDWWCWQLKNDPEASIAKADYIRQECQ